MCSSGTAATIRSASWPLCIRIKTLASQSSWLTKLAAHLRPCPVEQRDVAVRDSLGEDIGG